MNNNNNNNNESDYNIEDDDISILVIDESEEINLNDEIMTINNVILKSKDIDLQNQKEIKDSIDKTNESKEENLLLNQEKPDKPFKSIFEVIKINKVFKRNDIDPRNILNKRTRYSNLIEKKYF